MLFGGLLIPATQAVARQLDLNRLFRAFYNWIAPAYDHIEDVRLPVSTVRQPLVDLLDPQPGDHVLEVGVGTGGNLPYIADRIGASGRIYGLDISEGMLAQARQKLSNLPCQVELRWGMAEEIPYPDDTFDSVLHLGGVNWFSDRRRALEEMARVARPGARIVVSDETVPSPDGPLGLLARARLLLGPRLRPPLVLIPALRPELHYLAGGCFYAVVWTKG